MSELRRQVAAIRALDDQTEALARDVPQRWTQKGVRTWIEQMGALGRERTERIEHLLSTIETMEVYCD